MSWPEVDFEQIAVDVSGGNSKTAQSDFLPSGQYPIVDQGQSFIAGYSNDKASLCKTQGPVVVFGDHTKCFKFVDFPFCMGADGTKVLSPKDGVDAKYLYYALQTARIPEAGYSRHFKYLKAAKFPLAPLPEQRRVAAILDQADALRRLRRQCLDRVARFGEVLLHQMFGDLATQPRTHALTEIAEIQKSLVDPRLPRNRAKLHVGPEHIAPHSGVIDWKLVNTAEQDALISGKNAFDSESIIYSKIRPYLNKVALPDRSGLCSADMYVIKPRDGKASRIFLHAILMSRDFLSYAETVSNRANIPKVNRGQVEAYKFACPSYRDQQDFERYIAAFQEVADNVKIDEEHLDSLFTSLQHRAFHGEL